MIRDTLNKLFNVIYKDSICVFLYHEVSDHPSELNKQGNSNILPPIFREQIKNICNLFSVITPKQLISGNFETPAALITFDDGTAGYFENAVPILEDLKCPSLIFLNMATVDGEIFWAGLVAYLTTFDQNFKKELNNYLQGAEPPSAYLYCTQELVESYLKKMGREKIYTRVREFCGRFCTRKHLSEVADNEYVYLGNHLYNHYNAVMLSDKDLRTAFLQNEAELEKYPNNTKIFSYPFGHPSICYNDETNSLILKLGARIVFSAYPSFNYDKNSLLLHRFTMTDNIYTEKDIKYALMRGIFVSSIRNWDPSVIINHLKHIRI